MNYDSHFVHLTLAILEHKCGKAEFMLEDNEFAKACLLAYHLSNDAEGDSVWQYMDALIHLCSGSRESVIKKINARNCLAELKRRSAVCVDARLHLMELGHK